jgi:hypothetical protein
MSNRSNVPSNKRAGAGWRLLAVRWHLPRELRCRALVLAGLMRLISVRSVVQLYPGPYLRL